MNDKKGPSNTKPGNTQRQVRPIQESNNGRKTYDHNNTVRNSSPVTPRPTKK